MTTKLTAEEKAERAMSGLEGMADKWAADVGLNDMIDNIASPMNLSPEASINTRQDFAKRMREQIDAIVRQAWIEGAYAARQDRLTSTGDAAVSPPEHNELKREMIAEIDARVLPTICPTFGSQYLGGPPIETRQGRIHETDYHALRALLDAALVSYRPSDMAEPPPAQGEIERRCVEMLDRATTIDVKDLLRDVIQALRHRPLCDREGLARWLHIWFSKNGIMAYLDHMPGETPQQLADALLASNLVRAMPSADEISTVLMNAEKAAPPLTPYGKARAVMGLFTAPPD